MSDQPVAEAVTDTSTTTETAAAATAAATTTTTKQQPEPNTHFLIGIQNCCRFAP
jgi:hypothetical protein